MALLRHFVLASLWAVSGVANCACRTSKERKKYSIWRRCIATWKRVPSRYCVS